MLNIKQFDAQYVTNESGEKTAVIIPISSFEEMLEDMEDLAAIAERKDEPTVAHEEFKKELKRDGFI